MGRLHFGFRGTQRPPAPTHCCSQLQRLLHAQHSSQTFPSSPNSMDIAIPHHPPLRKGKGRAFYALAEHHHPGMRQTRVQVPEGNVYPVQYKHTGPGSNILRRDALSHFVEINTKFISSQPRVCLAHIRPRISTALALLQELETWGSVPQLGFWGRR